MVENFYASVPPMAWGCDMSGHIEYERLLEDSTLFTVLSLPHPAAAAAMMHLESNKFAIDHQQQVAAPIYAYTCEDMEALMNWDHLLRPVIAPAVVPSGESVESSSANSPCVDTSASEAESAKRCTPEPSKRTRASRKRSDSSLTESPSPTSPTPKRRRSSSKNTEYVPVVKSKRARAMELMMKRDNHNDSERQRRCEMKDGLNSLKSVLPAMKGVTRMNTSQLLEYAIAYIKEVVDEEKRLAAEKEALLLENERLQLIAPVL
jgi:hypothetical protein